MKKFMCILTAIMLCGCEDPVLKQQREDTALVYQREVDLCVCGHVNLPNYTDVLVRAGVDILHCCQQKQTACISNQSMSDIQHAANLIRKGRYSQCDKNFNLRIGQERRWKCSFPMDFCFTSDIAPGQIVIKR